MKIDRVSLEIAVADGTFACHELNRASVADKDHGLSCAAKIQKLLREMHLLIKRQTNPGCGFAEIDLEAAYLAADTGSLRLAAIVSDHRE